MSNLGTNPVRSPAYPSMALPEAVEAVAKIESAYRQAQVDRVVAAKMLGYSGLNGPSAKALSALAHYGLVERAGKGEMRVTDLARAILHPDNVEERRDGLRKAAMEPSLFRELAERWPDIIPPEDGVTTYLNRKGFNQTAIRPAARAYLKSMLYIKEEEGSDSHGIADQNAPESGDILEPENNMTTELVAKGMSTSRPSVGTASMAAFARVASQPLMRAEPTLNKIGLNMQGHLVLVEALLDYEGLLALEKKIGALKEIIDRPSPSISEAEDEEYNGL